MRTIATFGVCLLLSLFLAAMIIRNRNNDELMAGERLITEKCTAIAEIVSRLLYKTQALAALVIQNNGEIERFERVAATLVDDPAILNVLMAPDGVVTHVYPLAGNEEVLGFSLLGEGAGNKEAIQARERGQLVFGGPFTLVQGGRALVGRLPVYLDAGGGEKRFWGLVSVTLRYPEVLAPIGLDSLESAGFAYEIWRINPDTDQRQVIAGSEYPYDRDGGFVERHFQILNADWYFRLLALRRWYDYPENWAMILMGICISLLFAFIIQNNMDLKAIQGELEGMLRTDPMTGILNRQGLFYEMEGLMAEKREFQLNYLDLNYFKNINDTYGHNVGDAILAEFVSRFGKHLTHNQLFARVGGDEFILADTAAPGYPATSDTFWERIAEEFAEPASCAPGEGIRISFSRGVSSFPQDGDSVDKLIHTADQSMYAQKNQRYSGERKRRLADWGVRDTERRRKGERRKTERRRSPEG